MDFEFDQATAVLQATPSVLQEWLGDLPPEWTHANDGEGTWSPFDIVGHLIHGEKTDWIPRAEIILSEREIRQFEPFDRFAMFADSEGKTLQELLDTFADLRQQSIDRLLTFRLTEADLDKTGVHPDFGTVTLRQLLATWVAHDLNHLGQIAKVKARQYRAEVGPWHQFLGILS